MAAKVVIRKILPSDVPVVVELIKELAVFLKCPNEFSLTPAQIKEHLKANLFTGRIAFVDNEPAGMFTFFTAYSSWKGPFMHGEDLIVRPKFRNMQIGLKLWIEGFKYAADHDLQRFEGDVLKTNAKVLNMYKRFNGVNVTEVEGWQKQRISREDIVRNSKLLDHFPSKL